MKIVETDNYGRDYPNEKFVNLPSMDNETTNKIATLVNDYTGEHSSRYWKVVENDYTLAPIFKP